MDLEKRLSVAKKAVLEAGKLIMGIRRSNDLGVDYDSERNPVTKAEFQGEDVIREIILSEFSEDSFEGKKSMPIPGNNGFKWACIPIDGIWSYINYEKTAAVSLALFSGKEIVLGFVYNFFTDEMYVGGQGLKTTVNDDKLPKITRNFPEVVNFQISREQYLDIAALYGLWRKKQIKKLVSVGGSIAYNLAQVAEGNHNCYLISTDKSINLWDVAAGIHLVRSVNGKVTDLDGKNLQLSHHPRIFIASNNSQTHQNMLKLLQGTRFGKY
mgnify:CR=1 FL=1